VGPCGCGAGLLKPRALNRVSPRPWWAGGFGELPVNQTTTGTAAGVFYRALPLTNTLAVPLGVTVPDVMAP
jgi:hypothetical protein